MKNLTEGDVGKNIMSFALPLLLGNVFQQFYNITDSIVVGRFISEKALAATGASFYIIFVLISLVIGIANGGTILISQFFGAKRYKDVKLTIDTVYIMMFSLSFVLSLLGIYFSEDIFRWILLPEDIIPQATTYLNIYLVGMVPLFGFNGTNAILRGLGDSRTPLVFVIVSALLNIVLDLVFVLVFDFGLAGVASATVIAQTSVFIAGVIYLNKKHELINLNFFNLKFDKNIFIKSMKIGLPSGMQTLFVSLGMLAVLSIVNPFGEDVIAAYTVASRIDSLAILPAMSFSMALSTFTGQNLGAKKPERVKQGLYFTIKSNSVISVFFTLVAIFFGRYIMSAFSPKPEIIEIGYEYLVIVSSFYIAFSTMFAFHAIFRGAGDTIVPMFITLFSLWVIRVPISYYFSQFMGSTGIWWGIPTAWCTGMILTFLYYRIGRWKTRVVIK